MMQTKVREAASLAMIGLALFSAPVVQAQRDDSDGDGIADAADNCAMLFNANQRDSNADGFGNACDADLNNDGMVNATDLGLLRLAFFSVDSDADSNGDGIVNTVDLGAMRSQFFAPPGPSSIEPIYTRRVYKSLRDTDMDGQPNTIEEIGFGPDGRIKQWTFGDAMMDLTGPPFPVTLTVDFFYLDDGRLDRAATKTLSISSLRTTTNQLVYEGGELVRVDVETDVKDSVSYERLVPVRQNGALVGIDYFVSDVAPDALVLDQQQRWMFNDQSWPVQRITEFVDLTIAKKVENYVWNMDGSLATREEFTILNDEVTALPTRV
ncbi:MAG: thrombospondin type 3 repeat-containing protein, partial [Gammaproteobacteria bacterium]